MRITGLIVTLLVVSLCRAADQPSAKPPTRRYDVAQLHHEIRQVVQRHFPEATSHRLSGKIHFEHDTRVFVIHEQLKTGEWQDPSEERGPKRDGVVCDVEVVAGEYGGAAATPQDFDKRYFTRRVMTPYSKRLRAHLRVDVRYSKSVPAGFLDQLSAVVNDFDKFVDVAKDAG
jgi:hypothetical protein